VENSDMERLQSALDAWRAAERRVMEAASQATPDMLDDLETAKRHYQELASAHTAWEPVESVAAIPQRTPVASLRRVR
jgi:hypothetical protein